MSNRPEKLANAIRRMENVRGQREAAYAAMDYVIGCFDAAEAEGLTQALEETPDARLKDLVERRLMHALYKISSFDRHRGL